MSDALIASQNTRISQLERENAELRSESKKYRLGRRDAQAEAATLKAQVEQLTAERDRFKAQAEAAPGEQAQTITRLQGEIRTRDHRDLFTAEASRAGVRPEAVADLYRLSGLTPPESGEAKAEDFAAFLTAAKSERSWAFGTGASGATQPPGGATQGLQLGATPPPAGSGRGAPGTSAGQVQYTRAQVQVPGWQEANPDLVKALAEGRAVRVEG